MKPFVSVLACAAIFFTSGAAIAHPQKMPRTRVLVTGASAVHPDVAKMIKMGVDPDVARMIVAARPSANLGIIQRNAGSGSLEWRNTADTFSGVPPRISGSTFVNPWVDRTSPAVRRKAGLGLPPL